MISKEFGDHGVFAQKYPGLTAKALDMIESSLVENGKIFLKLPQENLLGAVAYNTITHETTDITDQAVFMYYLLADK